ncbi:hypothetical protein ABZ805_28530, partial [Saccharopolyspora sp. NPDC047091]
MLEEQKPTSAQDNREPSRKPGNHTERLPLVSGEAAEQRPRAHPAPPRVLSRRAPGCVQLPRLPFVIAAN